MKHSGTKRIASLLVLLMLVSMLPIGALAAGEAPEAEEITVTEVPFQELPTEEAAPVEVETAVMALDADDGIVGLAQDGDWEGEGTEASPYLIASVADLKKLAENVNGGETYNKTYFKVTADIDLNNETWTPIGTSSSKFQGIFDGGWDWAANTGYTISNLTASGSSTGLFGYTTSPAVIQNLHIKNVTLSGGGWMGAVAGQPYTSTVSNILLDGLVQIDGYYYVGGMLGYNFYGNGTNLTINADSGSYVKATSGQYATYVGGVVGFRGEGGSTLSNVSSNIDVYGDTCYVGGISGNAHYGNKFVNVTCSGKVYLTNPSEEDAYYVGGIAGNVVPGTTVSFEGCSYDGKLTVTLDGEELDLKDDQSLVGVSWGGSASQPNILIDGQPVVATNGNAYYTDLEQAAEEAEPGDTLTVYEGSEVSGLPDGVTVANKTSDELTVNGETVAAGDDHTVGGVASVTTPDGEETRYQTLAAAIAAAQDGDTVTVLKNIDGEADHIRVQNGKSITLDLQTYTVNTGPSIVLLVAADNSLTITGKEGSKLTNSAGTTAYAVLQVNGTATLEGNVTVDGTIGAGLSIPGGTVTINDNVTVSGVTYGIQLSASGSLMTSGAIYSSGDDGAGIQCMNSSVELTGGTVEGVYGITVWATEDQTTTVKVTGNASVKATEQAGITTNGSETYSGQHNIEVSGNATVEGGVGLYLPNLNNNAVISGSAQIIGKNTGIEIRGGSLTVKDNAAIIANASPTQTGGNLSGTTTIGAGIAVAQHTTKGEITVTIEGGTVSGYTAVLVHDPQKNELPENITININNGDFIAINGGDKAVAVEDGYDVSEFVHGGNFSSSLLETGYLDPELAAELHSEKKNPDAPFSYYKTMTDALKEAQDGDTVTHVGTMEDPERPVPITFNSGYDDIRIVVYTAVADMFTLPENEYFEHPAGYAFTGWKAETAVAALADGDADADVLQPGEKVALSEAGLLLTAQWDVPEVDKTELKETIGEAEALAEDDYTAESWEALEAALAEAKAVLDDENATQDEVDAATKTLKDAIAALEKAVEDPTPSPIPSPEVTPDPMPEPEVTPDPMPEPEVTPDPNPAPKTFTVTFDPNGGECGTASMETQEDGTLAKLPVPTRDGMHFAGWYTAKDGGKKISTKTVFLEDTTVYARWTKVPVTGDESNLGLWGALLGLTALALCAGGVTLLIQKKKK